MLLFMRFQVEPALKSAVLGLSQSSINVLIAYNEIAAGRCGMDLFSALRHDVPPQLDLRCDLWRFDLIGLPGIHEAAVLAARHAQIIIVAAGAEVDLPERIKDWLDQSFIRKSPGSAMMVALMDSAGLNDSRDVSPPCASLELMAHRRKFPFFVASLANGRTRTSLIRRTGWMEMSKDSHRTSPRPPRPPRWGINE
jgi:hypothetical protein